MKSYTIKVLEETVICDSDMEESYGMVNVLDSNSKIVGVFQMCSTEIIDEEEYIKELEKLNAKELMKRPYLEDVEPLLQSLHNHLMGSSNLCLYGDDMEGWLPDELDMTWEEILKELKKIVNKHKSLDKIIEFGECQFIVFGDFMSAFNLHTVEIDWKEVALDLLNLAETLNDDVGDMYNGLRDRLRVECNLTEEQLDKIGV